MGMFKGAIMKGTILAVDDNPANLDLIFDLLGDASYQVLVAKDGESAITRAQKTSPDLILLDVMMPGPAGMALATRLMELYPSVIVLIVTAYSSINLAIEVIQKGAHGYLVKPVRPKQLLDRVEEAWNASRQGEPRAAAGSF